MINKENIRTRIRILEKEYEVLMEKIHKETYQKRIKISPILNNQSHTLGYSIKHSKSEYKREQLFKNGWKKITSEDIDTFNKIIKNKGIAKIIKNKGIA